MFKTGMRPVHPGLNFADGLRFAYRRHQQCQTHSTGSLSIFNHGRILTHFGRS